MKAQSILSWIFADNYQIAVIFAYRNPKFKLFIRRILEETDSDKRVVIIDLERRIASQHITTNTTVFRPKNIIEQTKLLLSLEQIITNNVQLLIVLGLPTYLRDYIGKSAKKNTLNNRIIALNLSILEELSKKTNILVHTYRSDITPTKSIYANITNYYVDNQILLEYEQTYIYLSKQNNQFQIKI